MVNSFVPIDIVLDRLIANPLIKDVDRDFVIQKAVEFYSILNLRGLYVEKNQQIKVVNHKGLLPCTLIELIQVKDLDDKICLTQSTDNFMLSDMKHTNVGTFKLQGHVIFTSKKDCNIMLDYVSIPEENEEPTLVDDPLFLRAFELFCKRELYLSLFEFGKINYQVYNIVDQEYYFNAGKLEERYKTPSISEAQALVNEVHRPIWETQQDFLTGYRYANNLHKRRVQ